MKLVGEDVYVNEQHPGIDPSKLGLTVVLLSNAHRYKIARYLLYNRKGKIKTLMLCCGADFSAAREHVKLMMETHILTKTFENLQVDYSPNRETLHEVFFCQCK